MQKGGGCRRPVFVLLAELARDLEHIRFLFVSGLPPGDWGTDDLRLLPSIRPERRACRSALTEAKAMVESVEDLPFGHPDGSLVRRAAARRGAEALSRYHRAIQAVNP